ncbi:hypothetical protein [Streptomyces sp. GQFP]|uniref:hypothetical protein n=1 Tax=Streptomyces sp. GQFP TaxID=2907545 RepID=UPI001F3E20D3|nr:hypothetical protein [Streptomyces sp. GQFP]UIX31198.1 hypothetical protein LUX31_14760 [Streptomyces sp. GQFP]
MTTKDTNGTGADRPDDEPLTWDFRLDRSGLIVKAGRYLHLRTSLGLLLWLIAVCASWGAYHWNWPLLP